MFGIMTRSQILQIADWADNFADQCLAAAAQSRDYDEDDIEDLDLRDLLLADDAIEPREDLESVLADEADRIFQRGTFLIVSYVQAILAVAFLNRLVRDDKRYWTRYEEAVKREALLAAEVRGLVIEALAARGDGPFPKDNELQDHAARLVRLGHGEVGSASGTWRQRLDTINVVRAFGGMAIAEPPSR